MKNGDVKTQQAGAQKKLSPVFAGIFPYRRAGLWRDVLAGVTLAAAAIPIDMGYTKIAGMPITAGLYILLLPAVAFAVFGASRHLVVGADSASAAILAAAVLSFAAAGSSQYGGYAALLSLMVGVVLLVCRVFKLGFVANFLSRTVLTGFLTGIGIQVAISQLGDLFGQPDVSGSSIQKIVGFVQHVGQSNPAAVAISLCTFVVVFVPRLLYGRWPVLRRVPFGLVAIAGGVVAGVWAPAGSFSMVGAVQGGLPPFTVPTFQLQAVLDMLGPCIAIVVVIITQSAATAEVYADRYGEELHANRDILGLGAANVAAAFSGAFVANGSPTKTEIADEAGAKTQVANLTAAGVVLLVLLFFTWPLQYIPTATLAAVVLSASLGLVDIKTMKKVYAFSGGEFAVAVVTAAAVVLLGAAQGILLAMILSLLQHVKKSAYPRDRVLVAGANGESWRPAAEGGTALEGVVVYRFGASLYYANAGIFAAEVRALCAQPGVRELALDFSAVVSMDYSGCEMLKGMVKEQQAGGRRLVLVFVPEEVLAVLEKSGLAEAIGKQNIYATLKEYMERAGNLDILPSPRARG